MRLAILPLLLAVVGCATREEMRALQAPPMGPSAKIIAPYEHPMRDSIAIESVGGVSQSSYIFAEPNGDIIRGALQRALEHSGLQAGTPVRARYGLRVLVEEASGPGPDADFQSRLSAVYTLVERASGRIVFESRVDSTGSARYLKLNESDLKRAFARSRRLLDIINPAAAAFALVDLGEDLDVTPYDGGGLDQTDLYDNYSEWTQAEWNEFWELYRYSVLGALAAGPLSVGAEALNPMNYLPIASSDAAAHALRTPNAPPAERSGVKRAARSNQRAVAANIATFLLDFSESQHIPIAPILPCHGGPEVEAAKRALLAQGALFGTDDCRIPR